MIPIVVASWNMMLKPPRRCVGDISFRKSGTAWLAKPTPTPSDTRPRTSVATAAEPSEEEEEIPLFWLRRPAQEVMAAPTRKARPATSIEALRPHLEFLKKKAKGRERKRKRKKVREKRKSKAREGVEEIKTRSFFPPLFSPFFYALPSTHLRVTPAASSDETSPARKSELVKSCRIGESNLQ